MSSKPRSSSKTKAKSPKSASKKAVPSTVAPATVLHKLHRDTKSMLKLEWSADHGDFVGSPVSLHVAANIASKANPPFCKNTLNDPTKKYYCEFSIQYNQYICSLVDADDPRCRK
jgi:hypothetical protein